VNASIRLLPPLLLALLSSACVAGTPAGPAAPRIVREPMVLVDDGATRTAASPSVQQARPPEHAHASFVWSANAGR
jgi:hypothetical protein